MLLTGKICEQMVGMRYDFHEVFDLSYGRVENINCFELQTFVRKIFSIINIVKWYMVEWLHPQRPVR